jgi:hypothetical protein
MDAEEGQEFEIPPTIEPVEAPEDEQIIAESSQ